MNFAANSTLPEVTRVLTALALVCLITFVAFVTSDLLVRVLGQNASKVVSRLMGLILAVIGVQMVIEGGGPRRGRGVVKKRQSIPGANKALLARGELQFLTKHRSSELG
jgi:hypothetical protein